jgi:hypothetical protein
MSIPEACIEAASIRRVEKHGFDEARARRVILALAENMPEGRFLTDMQQMVFWDCGCVVDTKILRAAIIYALKDIAGDKP